MIESIFLNGILRMSTKGEQYSITLVFILCIGWCIMKIRSLWKIQKSMSEALKTKTDMVLCAQKHSEVTTHMLDLKEGNKSITKKIDDLVGILLKQKIN